MIHDASRDHMGLAFWSLPPGLLTPKVSYRHSSLDDWQGLSVSDFNSIFNNFTDSFNQNHPVNPKTSFAIRLVSNILSRHSNGSHPSWETGRFSVPAPRSQFLMREISLDLELPTIFSSQWPITPLGWVSNLQKAQIYGWAMTPRSQLYPNICKQTLC